MKKFFLFVLLLTLFSNVLAYTIFGYNGDITLNPYWFSPDEIIVKDAFTGLYHYFYFPPNSSSDWSDIKRLKDAGVGAEIEYILDHSGQRIITNVKLW